MPAVPKPTQSEPASYAVVAEVPVVAPPSLVHPGWRSAFPWLVQGTTTRGDAGAPFDLGLFSDASAPMAVLHHWERLRQEADSHRAVHAHQVHGAEVRFHGPGDAGLHLAEACDGHATAAPGVLLAVTTADCVPVFVVDPTQRAVAVLHAGWRGAAGGILEEGVAVMEARFQTRPSDVHVHLGPAICGSCYEVGPEVFAALGLPEPPGPAPVDLRRALADRAVALGVSVERISISAHCTRCDRDQLFSHRGGDRARQVGFLGVRG
jgi:YfiH family protein